MRYLTLDLLDPRSCPCCPDFGAIGHRFEAHPEPILVEPQAPVAGAPIRAHVSWFHLGEEVVGVSSAITVNGSVILIHGDVEVDIDPPTLPSFYSFTAGLPPLEAGTYRAQYWARDVMPGLPLGDYELQGEVVFAVQGSAIPADGPASRAVMVVALAGAALVLLRRRLGPG